MTVRRPQTPGSHSSGSEHPRGRDQVRPAKAASKQGSKTSGENRQGSQQSPASEKSAAPHRQRAADRPQAQQREHTADRTSSSPSGSTPRVSGRPASKRTDSGRPSTPRAGASRPSSPRSKTSHPAGSRSANRTSANVAPSRRPAQPDPDKRERPQRMGTKRSIFIHGRNGGRQFSLRLLVVGLFALMAVIIVAPTFVRYLDRQQEVAQARADLTQAQDTVTELERELSLWNDDDYVKAQARERLGYVMPGETLYVVSDSGEGTAQEQLESRVAEVNRDRRAATPWFVTMWDSITVAGQSGDEQDNSSNAPVLTPDGTTTTAPSASEPATDPSTTTSTPTIEESNG